MEYHGDRRNRQRKLFGVLGILLAAVLLLAILSFFPAMNDRGCYPPKAPSEIRTLQAAIAQFVAEYDYFPVTEATAQHSRDTATDFTLGIPDSLGLANARPANTEIMNILLVREKLQNRELQNSRKIRFLDLQQAQSTNDSGLGPDGTLRDPWGNPYIITLDLNGDGYCEDAFYSRPVVSSGHVGNPGFQSAGTDRDSLRLKVKSMIWSMGPDGKTDPNIPAKEGVNRDNVVSWE